MWSHGQRTKEVRVRGPADVRAGWSAGWPYAFMSSCGPDMAPPISLPQFQQGGLTRGQTYSESEGDKLSLWLVLSPFLAFSMRSLEGNSRFFRSLV